MSSPGRIFGETETGGLREHQPLRRVWEGGQAYGGALEGTDLEDREVWKKIILWHPKRKQSVGVGRTIITANSH